MTSARRKDTPVPQFSFGKSAVKKPALLSSSWTFFRASPVRGAPPFPCPPESPSDYGQHPAYLVQQLPEPLSLVPWKPPLTLAQRQKSFRLRKGRMGDRHEVSLVFGRLPRPPFCHVGRNRRCRPRDLRSHAVPLRARQPRHQAIHLASRQNGLLPELGLSIVHVV